MISQDQSLIFSICSLDDQIQVRSADGVAAWHQASTSTSRSLGAYGNVFHLLDENAPASQGTFLAEHQAVK